VDPTWKNENEASILVSAVIVEHKFLGSEKSEPTTNGKVSA
jgi:hypothetical protein